MKVILESMSEHLEIMETEREKDARWAEQEPLMRVLFHEGAASYMAGVPYVERAFTGGERVLCCMDEGAAFGDMRSAGSGILTEGDERTAFV
jgi:hypothetical protein